MALNSSSNHFLKISATSLIRGQEQQRTYNYKQTKSHLFVDAVSSVFVVTVSPLCSWVRSLLSQLQGQSLLINKAFKLFHREHGPDHWGTVLRHTALKILIFVPYVDFFQNAKEKLPSTQWNQKYCSCILCSPHSHPRHSHQRTTFHTPDNLSRVSIHRKGQRLFRLCRVTFSLLDFNEQN